MLGRVLRRNILNRPSNLSLVKKTGFASNATTGFNFIAGEYQATTGSGLTFGTGIMGHLSESSVLCKQGGSVVHAVVNSAQSQDVKEAFLPLTVDYRSRQYAFGIIPSTPQRRERHGGDDEILVARCIDRVLRPLFPKGYVDEVQVLVTTHAADGIHDPTIAAVNAASFALLQSQQPWYGPVGCVRVGLIDGELQVDPSVADMARSTLDLVYAGTKDRALMVEAIGEQIPEDLIQQAMAMANTAVAGIIDTQVALAKEISAKKNTFFAKKSFFTVPERMTQEVRAMGYDSAVEVYSHGVADKAARGRSEGVVRTELLQRVAAHPEWGSQSSLIQAMAVDGVMHQAFRAVLLGSSDALATDAAAVAVRRSDGRALDEVRPIGAATEVLPSVHGSAYFARGDTHVLGTVTLGSLKDSRIVLPIDGSGEEKKQPFMLHYDFPPYATGEMGNATAPNRRMVGHGNLAEKALRPVMPSFEDFPYAVRVFCECTGSNGSSSMASACAGSLALYDAGVPLKAAVAAVSVGLVTDESVAVNYDSPDSAVAAVSGKEFVLLKDILGSEDHHGDMDYKIGGTERGITAIQLDVKLPGGVPLRILDQALETARQGRLHILEKMQTALAQPRSTVKPQAPKAEWVRYDADRKPMLIGPRGDMKRYMEELYSVTIDLDTAEGVAYIHGQDGMNVAACSKLVQDIAVLVKEGDTVTATVTSVMDFGLLVTINRAQQALLHISDLSHDTALLRKPTTDLVKPGQRFNVKITTVDKATGVIKVSRRALLDAKASVPDTIRPLESETGPSLVTTMDADGNVVSTAMLNEPDSLPTFSPQALGLAITADFPMSPPRVYSPEFFHSNVVPEKEVESAVQRQRSHLPLKGSSTVLNTTSAVNHARDKIRQAKAMGNRERDQQQPKDRKRTSSGDKQSQHASAAAARKGAPASAPTIAPTTAPAAATRVPAEASAAAEPKPEIWW